MVGEGGVDFGLFLYGESYWFFGGVYFVDVGVVFCVGVVCVYRFQGLQIVVVCGVWVDVESVVVWV